MKKEKSGEKKKKLLSQEKLKKEKKALKKLIKAQDKRERELDKREKKLKKKEKKLKKQEEELFDLITNYQTEENDAPIMSVVEDTVDESEAEGSLKIVSKTLNDKVKHAPSELKIEEDNKATSKKEASDDDKKDAEDTKDDTKQINSSKKYNVKEGSDLIQGMDDEQEINQFIKGDKRKTIIDAGEKRIEQLKGISSN